MHAPASPILRRLPQKQKMQNISLQVRTTIKRDKGSWKYLNTILSFCNGERVVLLKDVEDDPGYGMRFLRRGLQLYRGRIRCHFLFALSFGKGQ
jgi:hypothetical protein